MARVRIAIRDLSKTFTGRAIKAVAQDEPALRLMGANPVRIKQWAFGIATASGSMGQFIFAPLGGALMALLGRHLFWPGHHLTGHRARVAQRGLLRFVLSRRRAVVSAPERGRRSR